MKKNKKQDMVDIKSTISICCCFLQKTWKSPLLRTKCHLQFEMNMYIMALNDLKGELLLS